MNNFHIKNRFLVSETRAICLLALYNNLKIRQNWSR